MATRLYLLPIVTTAEGRAPKYLPARLNPGGTLPGMEGATWVQHSYVLEDLTVVAVEATDPQHVLLAAQADVIQVPPLDNTLGAGAVTQVQNFLEARNLPAGWVAVGQTYRFVLRTVLHIFYYYNAVAGNMGARVFGGTITLNSQMNDLSPAVRQRMLDAATHLGLDASGATGTTTIRQVLKSVAQQLDGEPVLIGGPPHTALVSI